MGQKHVQFDHTTRSLYSTDASNYQIMPIGVTYPRNADDVVAIHEITAQYNTPLLPRGGGSSLAGQTVNSAVVMDLRAVICGVLRASMLKKIGHC